MKKKIFLTGSTSYVGTKFIELYGSTYAIFGASTTDPHHPVDLLDLNTLERLFTTFEPNAVIHLAADVGRDAATTDKIIETNPAMTKNLVQLAAIKNIPFIFTSTEAVYGGKQDVGQYTESDPYQPRSPYGKSKVLSEAIVQKSGLPYLITRGHRHVGISKQFTRSKQFLDALRSLQAGQQIHLDSKKLFNPVLINHVCDVFAHYLEHDSDKQVLLNIGSDKTTTFYAFMVDIARELGINTSLIQPDGNEAGWPPNSSLSVDKLSRLGYPTCSYAQLLETIVRDNT